jgi:hypothetical protein
MKNERRKNWWAGLSPMNIVTLVALAVGAIGGYFRMQAQVEYNSIRLDEILRVLESEHDWAENKHSQIWDHIRNHRH